MYFVLIYENRITKPVEIVLRRGEEGRRGNDRGNKLRYIVSTYINITTYPPHNYYMLIKIYLK
jgi:hypothetical protein